MHSSIPSHRRLTVFVLVTMALLQIHCGHKRQVLDRHAMAGYRELRWANDSTLLVIADNADYPTQNIRLVKGKYSLVFKARGSKSKDILPHFVISYGPYTLRDMEVDTEPTNYTVNFELPETVDAPLHFIFDNHYSDDSGDRNIFLYFPIVLKPY